jgi:putative glycosyl hydrolase-like family 6 (GHL6) protein
MKFKYPIPGILILTLLLITCFAPPRSFAVEPIKLPERIKAFCVDFNWGSGGPNGFAKPGLWSNASPKEHVKWYKDLGANVLQTFCVSCNGYAWYKGGVVPEQPGLKTDFLTETVRLGHKEGMLVLGYFCVGANTLWGQKYPDESYGVPSNSHIPFTKKYIEYLCMSIKEALQLTDVDGFMLDWFFNGPYHPADAKLKWMPCEREMWQELMGKPFPGADNIIPERELVFKRLAVVRCWDRVHATAKSVKPDCIIWLSCHDLSHPQLKGSKILREVDWLMNEHPDPKKLETAKKSIGPKGKIIQCLCGWGDQHDASKVVDDPRYADIGFYGFAKPDEITSLPPLINETKDERLSGNAKNIEIMRKAYLKN